MANNINAKIYKNRLSACKFSKKVKGHVVKKFISDIKTHGKYSIKDEYMNCYYVVYWGNYHKLKK